MPPVLYLEVLGPQGKDKGWSLERGKKLKKLNTRGWFFFFFFQR